MTNQQILKLSSLSKIGLFICWLGLSYNLSCKLMPGIERVDPIAVMAKIINNLPLFFNIEGGQPLAPTDFAKNEIKIIKYN